MKFMHNILPLFAALLLCFHVSEACYAQDNTATVFIELQMDSAPAKVSGLLIFPEVISEIEEAEVEEAADNQYVISYQVKKSLLNTNSYVLFSAVAVSSDGKRFVAPLKSAANAGQHVELPYCEPSDPAQAIRKRSNVMTYQNIVKLREDRRDLKRNSFYDTLDPHTADRLVKLAKRLNLDQDIDLLDRKAPPLQKIYQLSRLENMLREYLNKGKKEKKALVRYQEEY